MTPSSDRPGSRRGGGLGWFLAGYVGVAGFFAIERVFRRPGAAASLAASSDDRGTTSSIVAAYGVAAGLSPVLRTVPVLRLPRVAAPLGLALEAAGLVLRISSMRTLGASYTRTLRTGEAQLLVESGPYRLVRHPGYAGSLLTWSGFALASRSLPVAAMTASLLGKAYRDRIRAEEVLLRRDLPGYEGYCGRTSRLVPFVW